MIPSIRKIAVMLTVLMVVCSCATSPTGRKQLMLVSEESAIVASREAIWGLLSDQNKFANL